MNIALIPPVPDLPRYAGRGDLHMLLVALFDRPEYIEYYREQADIGTLLILDNGAHETQAEGLGILPLLKLASRVRASEIVLPDVPGNAVRSIETTRRALAFLSTPEGARAYELAGMPSLMLVPQGRTLEAWSGALRVMLNAYHDVFRDSIPTIGFAKHHIEGGFDPRKMYDAARQLSPAGVIHCLGWPRNLWAIDELTEYTDDIRSIDSARPFVYALDGVLLEPGGRYPKYPKRADDYFNTSIPEKLDDLVQRNIEVFRAATTSGLIR